MRNVWNVGEGAAQSWHNGEAMHVDHLIEGHRTCRCNDGVPDEDFGDLVFELQLYDL